MYGNSSMRGERNVYGNPSAAHAGVLPPQQAGMIVSSYYAHGPIQSGQHYQPSISIATTFPSHTGASRSPGEQSRGRSSGGVSKVQGRTQTLASDDVTIANEDSIEMSGENVKVSEDDESMANRKEKTPMCLVNELARFNKITHQYSLTDEQGPAHKKTFYVTLSLGNEEYKSEGQSIKKAQHAAATEALELTKYPRPPAKQQLRNEKTVHTGDSSVTPTVELNALAMKLGQQVMYAPLDSPPVRSLITPLASFYGRMQGGEAAMSPPSQRGYMNVRSPGRTQPWSNSRQFSNSASNVDYRGNSIDSRFRSPRNFCVALRVGDRDYVGEGFSLQAARHSAASEALKFLRTLPLPLSSSESISVSPSQPTLRVNGSDNDDGDSEKKSSGDSETDTGNTSTDDCSNSNKSAISLVHEIALKRNFPVNFEVIRESGPPHLRMFITNCTCAEHTTEGEANSKRLSKRKAAERMIEELSKLPPISSPAISLSGRTKKMANKPRQNKTLIKVQKSNPDYGVGINPISRLAQVQQAKKDKEPVYNLVEERGLPRLREFVIQVIVSDHECNGVGPNKRLAKRHAAEQMLQLLGYSKPTPQPAKPAIKSEASSGVGASAAASTSTSTGSATEKKVHFREPNTPSPHVNRQMVPGVIVMPGATNSDGFSGVKHESDCTNQTTAAIVNQLLNTGSSSIMEAMIHTEQHLASGGSIHTMNLSSSDPQSAGSDGQVSSNTRSKVRPKDQLLYLASVLGFHVQFTDFPKGNNTQFLSIATLATTPPQHSHGSAATIEEANDSAALTALKNLAELGLDGMGCSFKQSGDSADRRETETEIG